MLIVKIFNFVHIKGAFSVAFKGFSLLLFLTEFGNLFIIWEQFYFYSL